MITLFNRVISLISIVGVLLTSFALINVLLQFSWLALLILMLAMLMVFLILKQEKQSHKVEIETVKDQPIEEKDELESKVQERTLELHIALQELEEANKELPSLETYFFCFEKYYHSSIF